MNSGFKPSMNPLPQIRSKEKDKSKYVGWEKATKVEITGQM